MSEVVLKRAPDALYFANPVQHYGGIADAAARFLASDPLIDVKNWRKFVDAYRTQIDGVNPKKIGWRGEYWGKMMRGAALVCAYTQDEELYNILTETVKDMFTVADEDGRVSSFARSDEYIGWDLWCRKYVLLGMEYYYEICRDEALKKEIVRFISRMTDYIMQKIGSEDEGKIPVPVASSGLWLGMNSASILEPVVWLYRLTGEHKYFKLATHIVEYGGATLVNIFEKAYENELYPYQYGVSKAYEMISCFEGLLEYYRITGIEKYKIACINFGKAVLDSDVTVIGSCGCTHELFDHSKNRQTAYYEGIMQETCVTVTWMKYCSQLLRLTGERVFADCMEQSFYNAYVGALNTEHKHCKYIHDFYVVQGNHPDIVETFLPFDSYSPLIPGKRGERVGGLCILTDNSYYGCCACIGSAGAGVFLKHFVLTCADGIAVNFYEKGCATVAYNDANVTIKTETAYPADGLVKLTVSTDRPVEMTLKLRNPAWSNKTAVKTDRAYEEQDGYIVLSGEWTGESCITLDFDMSIRTQSPVVWDTDWIYTKTPKYGTMNAPFKVEHKEEDDKYICLFRGPLTLAADSRMGKDAASTFSFEKKKGSILCKVCDDNTIADGASCSFKGEFTSEAGEKFYLVDYASAGRDWDTVIAAWLPIE